ncbi:hypothetical protein ACFV1L_06170 [Kitasatospora sp. NPDC059646]|uniref:hypothetical protein n=1 Tax=Kitasatospora sp. NPDC059646 TaxID=3346893 RepID=UPI0036AEBE2F
MGHCKTGYILEARAMTASLCAETGIDATEFEAIGAELAVVVVRIRSRRFLDLAALAQELGQLSAAGLTAAAVSASLQSEPRAWRAMPLTDLLHLAAVACDLRTQMDLERLVRACG